MGDFFNQEEVKNIVLTKEHDIENVAEFSRQNPNITLANFIREEEKVQATHQIDLSKLQRFENNVIEEKQQPSIHDRYFKTQKDKALELKKVRAKIYASIFIICTIILTAFVIYNLVATVVLNNKANNNLTKIKDLNKQIDQLIDNDQPSLANIVIPKDLKL